MVRTEFEAKFAVRYTRLLIRHKYKFMIASILFAALLASGGRFLGFTNDYRVFFGEDNPQLLAFEEVEDTYTKTDNVMFVVEPKSGKVFTKKSLAAIQALTERAWQVPYSTRVDSVTNFQHTRAEGDDLFVDDLVPGTPESLTDRRLEEIREIAVNEPILVNRIVNPKSSVTGVNVSIQVPGKDPQEVIEVTQFSRELRRQFLKDFPDYNVYLSGIVIMNNAFAESGQKDAMTLTPLMYLVMMFIMALLLRSFTATGAAVVVIFLSTAAAMGFAGYVGIKLTPPSAIAPTVILTLAIADSVHILTSMLLLVRKGWDKLEALVESMRINFAAVLLTSITTVIGFLCLNFSDAPPYHDLGNITAVGVTLAFIFSVTFLPAAMAALPLRVKQKEVPTQRYLERFAEFVVGRRRSILVAFTMVFVVLTLAIPNLSLNDQFVRWFDKRLDFRNDTDFMMDNLTGIYNFEYSINAGEAEGVSEPQFMQKVRDFANWWKTQPETKHVSTYTDIMKKLNKTMHEDKPEWYRLPDNVDLAAQYLLLYEMSLPFGLDLNNQIDIDKSAIKMVVTFEELTTQQARRLADAGDKWLVDNAPGVMHAAATGPSVMFSHISDRNIRSMIKGTALALALITLLMILALRSMKYGLISLLANGIPLVMALGLWTLLFKQAGMAVSIVGAGTLGIIVDDSVHFLTKFLRAIREEKKSAAEAVGYAFSHVGLAIVITSVILVIGFGMLTYSSFHLNWSLGFLSTITIVMALLADFIFLPALLLFVDRQKGEVVDLQPAKTA